MSTKKLKLALQDPQKQSRTSPSVLQQIFWKVVANYKITWPKWERCIKRFVHNPSFCVQIPRRQSERRNNLHIALTNKTALSWPKFIDGLLAIDIRRIRIRIELWRGDDEVHTVVEHEYDLTAGINMERESGVEEDGDKDNKGAGNIRPENKRNGGKGRPSR